MHIAIICQKDDTSNNYGNYLQQLLFDTSLNGFKTVYLSQFLRKREVLPGNLCIIIEAHANSKIGLQLWNYVQLPYLLKKIKADIVLWLDGFVSNTVKLPQLLVIPSAGYFESKAYAKKIWQKFSRKKINKSIHKAAAVIACSQNTLLIIENFSGAPIFRSHVIPYTASGEFKILQWPDKVLIKGSYTNNKEFFAAVINNNEQDFTELLKAFSVFKKWQQSRMQLLLLTDKDLTVEKFDEKLAAYKYRGDVKLLQNCTDKQFALIMGSAYCVLYNRSDENLLPLVQAVQSAVPVIAYKSPGAEEYADGVVLFSESNTYESMASQMIFLYKNENLKEKLASMSQELATRFNQQQERDRFWSIIMQSPVIK